MSNKKRISIFVLFALFITIVYLLSNIDDFNRKKAEKLYSATSVVIINAKGENLKLNNNETQELVDSMGSVPLSKDVDRMKTPFNNKMKFYINDRVIYEIHFGMPSGFNKNSQVIIKNKPYVIQNSFYKKLSAIAEKYNLNLDL